MTDRTITDTEIKELREWFAARVQGWDDLTDANRQAWEAEAVDTLEDDWSIGSNSVVEIPARSSVSGESETMYFPYEVKA
ncbi:MAG: hypothetical protein EBT03_11080 [Betaproteobacteria bacterium]|nr:hypothetical protein [Betaproteobacteria bacterium]